MSKLKSKYKLLPVQVKASLWFVICAFLQKGISLLTTPIFTRLLSTSEYGQYNVFNSWLGIVTIIVSLNLSTGVYTQGLIKFESEKSVFSSSLQGLSTCLTLFWTIIYIVFRNFWNNIFSLTTVQVLAMLIMIWTTSVFNFWSNEQRVEYKYKMLLTISLIVSLIKPIVGIIFVILSDNKVTARILGLVLVELIAYVGLYYIQIHRGKKVVLIKYWKYALKFSIPLVPHYLSQVVLNSADRIMISDMVGKSEAGIYSLAYSVSSIMTLFNIALIQGITPWIYQKIKMKRIDEIAPVAYITLLIVAIANTILMIFAPEAIALFAPESYSDAVYVIPPISMGVYFMFSYDLYAKYAFYYEKTKKIMVASLVGAIMNIILNYIFINLAGYRAAGYTTLVCYLVYSINHYIIMNKVCDECCEGIRPYSAKKILLISFSFVLVGFLILMSYEYDIVRYSIFGILTVIVFSARKKIIRGLNEIILASKKL